MELGARKPYSLTSIVGTQPRGPGCVLSFFCQGRFVACATKVALGVNIAGESEI